MAGQIQRLDEMDLQTSFSANDRMMNFDSAESGSQKFKGVEIPIVLKEVLAFAVSDETTNLSTGTAKLTFRMPFPFKVTGVRANVNTAPTGSAIIVDINEGGASILSTKLSIDASEKTSVTAASAAVISDADLADDAEITIDIDAVGSTIPGKGLKVYIIGWRTS